MNYIKYDIWVDSDGTFDLANRLNGFLLKEWSGQVGPYHQLVQQMIQKNLENLQTQKQYKGVKTMKLSYKGVTGVLLKFERTEHPHMGYVAHTIEIKDETDGHKHVFENVDVSDIKFIGATVTIA